MVLPGAYNPLMKIIWLLSVICGLSCAAQSDDTVDRRIVRPKGYHIISRPARKGETPPEVKQEKADDDRRRRQDTDISNQAPPTRDPQLKPKSVTP